MADLGRQPEMGLQVLVDIEVLPGIGAYSCQAEEAVARKGPQVLRQPSDFEMSMDESFQDGLLVCKGYLVGEDPLVGWYPPLELQVPRLIQWLLNQEVLQHSGLND